MRRLMLIAIFSLAFISLWFDFARAAAAGKIVLGYASPGRALPFWLAQDMGLFNKYGLDFDAVFIRGAPVLVAGLAAGDIQVGSTGGSATLAAVAGGQDLKIIANFGSRNNFDLMPNPTSNGRRTCAASASGSPASAARPGWHCCFGSSTSASMRSAIRCSSRPWANRH
jgi:ABC-type nitrate/sulfonate/bicarbonate transport system substrate-binding protein